MCQLCDDDAKYGHEPAEAPSALTDVLATVEKDWTGATIEGDYFRYDISPEGTEKENWSLYCDIQDDLREYGYEIIDPQIEHDCISGQLHKVANDKIEQPPTK